MFLRFEILIGILFPVLLFVDNSNNGIYKTNTYSFTINHPGEKEPVTITLFQNLNKKGTPIQYYMDVPSVICLEQVCKIIPVRLFWNNLGRYQKYELEEGGTLEKYKADLFEPKDYKKLQMILSDDNSPFKEVYYDEILTVVDEHNEESDAVSGATALALDEEDTVPGAALGCYTLWHWANGEIVEKIKACTGKVLSEHQIMEALKEKNRTYFTIGIIELEKRENFKESFIKAIINEGIKDESLLKNTFVYLEKSSENVYFDATKNIFSLGRKAQKLAAIRSLQYSKYEPKKSYLDNLSNQIASLESFQEVSSFLDLMQAKNPNSKKVIENAIALLNSDFIIARRIYWFLKNKNLTASHQEKLNQFYKKHKSNL